MKFLVTEVDVLAIDSESMASRSSHAQQSAAEKAADFANYFCTYGFLYHQKDMLSDRVRMTAYHDAVFKNRDHFDGKVRNLPALLACIN